MTIRQILFTTLLMGFTGLVGYWSYTADNPNVIARSLSADAENAPDFFIKNAHIKEFGPEGQLESLLISKEISHFPHNEITLLQAPDLLTFQENSEPWHTTSDHGQILPDGETVELIDNVVMIQHSEDGKQEKRVDTDFMTVYSGQDFADTDRPVKLTDENSIVNAVGMRVFYKRDFIQLKSRVRSIHESR